jgi:DNA-binding transcriptional LysR family regulator
MNSLQIEYFLSIAEHKNFTTAAKLLYSSQSNISKQIASLESELGFALFFRSNRDVSLTPAGIVFLKTFTDMKDQFKCAVEHINDIYNQNNKRILLGCLDGMEISGQLNKIFESFRELYPDIEYELERDSPGNLIKRLHDGNLDAIITIESLIDHDKDLCSSIFLNAKHTLYTSARSHHLTKGSLKATDFEDETFLVLSQDVFPTAKDNFFRWCKENGLNPKKIQYVPNVESQTLSVEAGLGVVVADSIFRLHTNPLIRAVELNTSHNVCILWKKDNENLLVPSFAKLASQINSTTI